MKKEIRDMIRMNTASRNELTAAGYFVTTARARDGKSEIWAGHKQAGRYPERVGYLLPNGSIEWIAQPA